MLKGARETAVEVFGLTDEKKIKEKMESLARLAKLGKIPSVRLGKHWYYDPATFAVGGVIEDKPARWLRGFR